MHAVVSRLFRSPAVRTIPFPEAQAHEVLVRVYAVGLNPADIKLSPLSMSGKVCGCEWSGVIEEVGSEVRGLQPGDRVAGFAAGGQNSRTAAFAEFICVPAESVFHIPSTTSMQAAATMCVGMVTSLLTLRQFLGFPDGSTERGTRKGPLAGYEGPLLVWSGTTAFGMHAVQLAKILSPGRQVIVTASPDKHELLRTLGADHCFDYGDPDVVAQIRKLGPIRAAIDTFGEKASTEQAASCLTGSSGDEAVIVSSQPSKPFATPKLPLHVKLEAVMSYTASGEPVRVAFVFHWPASPEDALESSEMMKSLPSWIKAGQLKPMPHSDVSQSIARPASVQSVLNVIVDEGLPLIAAGKVRGEKLVATLRQE